MRIWPFIVLTLLVFAAIGLAVTSRPAPAPTVIWSNPDLGDWYSSLAVSDQGPVVSTDLVKVTQLSAQNGLKLSELEAEDRRVIQAADGTLMLRARGAISELAFPKPPPLLELPGGEDIVQVSSKTFAARHEGHGATLYDAGGKRLWSVEWPGQVHSANNDKVAYGHTLGWVAGLDLDTGHVLWDARSQIEPIVVGGNVIVVRGKAVRQLGPDGKEVWRTVLDDKLIAAKAWKDGVCAVGEQRVYMLGLDGKLRWKREQPGVRLRHVSADGLVLLIKERQVKPRWNPIWLLVGGSPRRQYNADQTTTVIAVTPKGRTLWQWNAGEAVYDLVAQSDAPGGAGQLKERVYAAMKSAVVALDPAN